MKCFKGPVAGSFVSALTLRHVQVARLVMYQARAISLRDVIRPPWIQSQYIKGIISMNQENIGLMSIHLKVSILNIKINQNVIILLFNFKLNFVFIITMVLVYHSDVHDDRFKIL